MRILSAVLFSTLLSGSACTRLPAGDAPAVVGDKPVVAATRDAYHAGESVTLRLANPLREALGYNACSWTLQRQLADEWKEAPYEGQRACTMELRMLGAGDTATAVFGLHEKLPDGRYRLRATLHQRDSGDRMTRYSAPFRVEAVD